MIMFSICRFAPHLHRHPCEIFEEQPQSADYGLGRKANSLYVQVIGPGKISGVQSAALEAFSGELCRFI